MRAWVRLGPDRVVSGSVGLKRRRQVSTTVFA
jgi:hypothetical protein